MCGKGNGDRRVGEEQDEHGEKKRCAWEHARREVKADR